jgi:hypothetical protein
MIAVVPTNVQSRLGRSTTQRSAPECCKSLEVASSSMHDAVTQNQIGQSDVCIIDSHHQAHILATHLRR